MKKVTVENKTTLNVISFELTYFSADENSLKSYIGEGNELPDALIQDIISFGTNRFVLENIYLDNGGKPQGFRSFHLK